MEFVEKALLVLHFLGLAALLGGFLVQMSSSTKAVNNAMLHGVLTQLVTGILLVGTLYGLDEEPNNPKITVKLVILLVIAWLVVANRKKESISTAVWATIGGLTVLNVVIAVFW